MEISDKQNEQICTNEVTEQLLIPFSKLFSVLFIWFLNINKLIIGHNLISLLYPNCNVKLRSHEGFSNKNF